MPYNLFYGKFPNFVETAKNSYKEYNETMDLIEKLESENKILVLRPSKFINVKRVEKDTTKLQNIYELGVLDCMQNLDRIGEYLIKQ